MRIRRFGLCLVIAASGVMGEETEPKTITGVLMDASCPVIAEGKAPRQPEPAPETARPVPGTTRMTVRQKYSDCMVKAATKVFALHADGKLYKLNDTGNEMVHQQMRNEAFRAAMVDKSGAAKWMSVTVLGVPEGDRLAITSVRK